MVLVAGIVFRIVLLRLYSVEIEVSSPSGMLKNHWIRDQFLHMIRLNRILARPPRVLLHLYYSTILVNRNIADIEIYLKQLRNKFVHSTSGKRSPSTLDIQKSVIH